MLEKTEQEIMQNWKKDDGLVVSIHCTIYNHAKYLPKALDSFLNQVTNFPFVVVAGEDCSPDNSMEVLKEYKEKYPNMIKIISSENNVGQLENFLRTMNACEGKYVAMCDGDDYWMDNNKLQIQVDEMSKYPECGLCFHPAGELYGEEIKSTIARHHEGDKIFTTSEIIKGDGSFCPTSSLLLKKETFSNFPESFYKKAPFGDHFLQTSASLSGGALYLDKTMSVYRRDIEVSWSASTYANVEKRKKAFDKHMASMSEMDKLLEYKYKDEINQIKSKYYYLMAVFYLLHDNFKEFATYIEEANQMHKLSELKARMLYLFRNVTPVVKLIKRLKS